MNGKPPHTGMPRVSGYGRIVVMSSALERTHMDYRYDDGGRAASGRPSTKNDPGDCVCRAIAIATEQDYDVVYRALADRHAALKKGKRSARDGVPRKAYDGYLIELGWEWTPTMSIGSGTRVHLRADELPGGRVICKCSRHVVAVIDGVVHDTFDPTRDGTRAVYGYWTPPADPEYAPPPIGCCDSAVATGGAYHVPGCVAA